MNRQRKLETELESFGFVYDRRNSKGLQFWIHEATGAEQPVRESVTDNEAKTVLDSARRLIGLPTKDKRDAGKIRERNALARDAAHRQMDEAKAALAKYQSSNNESAVRAAVVAVEDAERKFRYWDRLMRSAAS